MAILSVNTTFQEKYSKRNNSALAIQLLGRKYRVPYQILLFILAKCHQKNVYLKERRTITKLSAKNRKIQNVNSIGNLLTLLFKNLRQIMKKD